MFIKNYLQNLSNYVAEKLSNVNELDPFFF